MHSCTFFSVSILEKFVNTNFQATLYVAQIPNLWTLISSVCLNLSGPTCLKIPKDAANLLGTYRIGRIIKFTESFSLLELIEMC